MAISGGISPTHYSNGNIIPTESPIGPTNPTNISPGNPKTYSAAVETQGGDYDRIMKSYQDLLESSTHGQKLDYSPLTPTTSNFQGGSYHGGSYLAGPSYQTSPEAKSALSNYKGLAETGGYTPEGIANIRARAISPIRSIYANAQRNLDRQRSLQGGYSPNYTAGSAKMARDLSEQISKTNTDAEASIAQNVASNRLSAAPGYASAVAAEDAMRFGAAEREINNRNTFNSNETTNVNNFNANEAARVDRINSENAASTTRTNEQNRMLPLQYAQVNNSVDADMFARKNEALSGMKSLYGTTPALASTFGNQVLQGQQQTNQMTIAQQQLKQQAEDERNRNAVSLITRSGPSY